MKGQRIGLEIAKVQNRNDFLSALRKTDRSVHPRTAGRTKDEVETYTICHLLSTLATADELAFPLSVQGRDRPDVLIEMGNFNVKIGVEITEAMPTQFADLSAFAEQKNPGHAVPAIHLGLNAPKFTYDEKRALLERTPPKVQTEKEATNRDLRRNKSSGWVAGEAEKEWADYILCCVYNKLNKLAKSEFRKYDQNWLSIYDNLPLPNVELTQAVAILRPLLSENWLRPLHYHAVFIEHNFTIVRITPNSEKCFIVNDPW